MLYIIHESNLLKCMLIVTQTKYLSFLFHSFLFSNALLVAFYDQLLFFFSFILYLPPSLLSLS